MMPKLTKGFFDFLKGSSDTPRDPDERVRDVLVSLGDDGETRRETTFWFYDGDLSALVRAAAAAGYVHRLTAKGDCVVLTAFLAVDEVAFEAVNGQMKSWAEEFGCDYDGWETAVTVKPN
jgi:hypothetical protein